MEKQKIIDFDFKKIIPTKNSKAETKISTLVTKKFLLITFLFGLGIVFANQLVYRYEVNEKNKNVIQEMRQHEKFLIAQQNKEMINLGFESQIVMYDDILKDIFETNKKIPNSAKTILYQNSRIRDLSQDYKESIIKIRNNFNSVIKSEDSFNKSSYPEKESIEKLITFYEVGSLNRSTALENLLITYTTNEVDEEKIKEIAAPIRAELKKQIIEKFSNLLGNNDVTKFKKLKIK